MKRLLLSAVLAGAIFAAQAQDIDKIKVNFEYVKLPLNPLKKNIKYYQGEVVQDNEAKAREQKAEYDRDVAAAKAEYDRQMEEYPEKVKEAENKYRLEMEEYNKVSTGKKIIDKAILKENNKPVKVTPEKPYLNMPLEPQYAKTYSGSMLASTYLKLEGYNQAPPSGGGNETVKIKVRMQEFDYNTEIKEVNSTVTSNGSTRTITKYKAIINYRFPMSVTLTAGTENIFDEFPAKLSEMAQKTSTEFSSQGEADMWARNNKSALQDKCVEDNMKYINELINSKFGRVKTKREFGLYKVEDKKVDYSDYQAAYEAASAGFTMLADDKAGAVAKFKEATTIWEKAMLESKPNDKKARIDGEVSESTLINMAEAYIFMDDFVNAEKALTKLGGMDISKKEKNFVKEEREFMKDMKTRFDANK